MTPRSHFDLVDLALVGAGVLGLFLFGYLLPSQHPDSAASFALGRTEVVEASRVFLEEQGYATEGLSPDARLTRLPALSDSLQAALGRPEMLKMLSGGGDAMLPVHHWVVRWHRVDVQPPWGQPASAGGPASDWRVYEVSLTEQGVPWRFRNVQAIVPRGGVDRDVLGGLLDTDPEMQSMLMAPTDSTLGALFYFDLSRADRPADSLALAEADWNRLHEAAVTGQPQGLGEAAATAIARWHIASTPYSALRLEVKAVEPLPERGRSAARVRFETGEPVQGQRVAIEADVSAAGALLGLRTQFNERREDASDGVNVQLGPDSDDRWRGVAKLLGYAVIVLLLLGVLFRRIGARALDTRAALKDALLAGTMAAAGTILAAPTFAVEGGYGWQLFLFLGIGMLFVGAGIGLLVLVVSGASDALVREAWPSKIETLTLARQGAWINQPVGRVLLRGAAVAGLVLGLATLALTAVPHGVVHNEALFTAEASFSVIGMALAQCIWYALLLILAVYVGVGSMVRKRWPRAVVPVLALLIGVIGFDAVDLPTGSVAVMWGLPLMLGLVLALLFVRYDALTLLVAVTLVGLLWDTSEGWLVAASPALADAMVGWALFAGVVGLGFVGVRSGRAGEQLPSYVPDYVAEQRERGRLARELEIAREVQRSFLPARMPRTTGLDIAARCIAAEEVGGDYYDVILLDDHRLALVIGDVSGKGIQAAFFMTLAKGFLQTLAHETRSPAEVLRRANRLFVANASPGTFISLIYGVFDLETQTFTFARAGHNPVILKRSPNQTADFVQPPGLAIGLTTRDVFDDVIQEQTISLQRGDTLVLYTDGFSEAMDLAKTLYTDERLADAVAETRGDTSAEDLLQAIVSDVLLHAGTAPQHDDMTMVVVRVGTLDERDAALPVHSGATSTTP